MPNIILDSVRGLQPVPIDDVFLKDRKIFLVGVLAAKMPYRTLNQPKLKEDQLHKPQYMQ